MRKLIAMRAVLWDGRMYQTGESLPTNTPVAEVWVENKVARWVDTRNPEGEETMNGAEEPQQADDTSTKTDLPSKDKPEGTASSVLDVGKPEGEQKRVGRNKPRNLT